MSETQSPYAIPAPKMGAAIRGEDIALYHGTLSVSASKLKTFARRPGGPQLYWQTYIAKTVEREDTDALVFGSALHCLVLEGREVYEQQFAVLPPMDRRTTLGKAQFAAFEAANEGRRILKEDTAKEVERMAENVNRHPLAKILLSKGEPELTWRIQAPGLSNCPPMQCRSDWYCAEGCELSEGRPYILDVKTCQTLDEDAFGNWQRGFEQHGYHRQAAFYMALLDLLGVTVRDFFFCAAEKCAPYGVEVCRLDERALSQGREEVARMLLRLDQCFKHNIWPNCPLDMQTMDLSPRYYANAKALVEPDWEEKLWG